VTYERCEDIGKGWGAGEKELVVKEGRKSRLGQAKGKKPQANEHRKNNIFPLTRTRRKSPSSRKRGIGTRVRTSPASLGTGKVMTQQKKQGFKCTIYVPKRGTRTGAASSRKGEGGNFDSSSRPRGVDGAQFHSLADTSKGSCKPT